MKQMPDKVFIDTNVLIYLYSEDEIVKKEISQIAIEKYECIISLQVLNEFSNVCIKKYDLLPEDIILAIDEIIGQCYVTSLTYENIKQALDIHKKYEFSYYDSLIITSALNSNCKYLFSEDLSDEQIINNKLTIINIYKDKNIEKYLNHA
jgi:predicted nucleic acid-binding protein